MILKKVLIVVFLIGCLALTTAVTSEANSYGITYWHSYSGPTANVYFGNAGIGSVGAYLHYWVNFDYDASVTPDPYFPDDRTYEAWCVSPQFSGNNVDGTLETDYSYTNIRYADWLLRRNNFSRDEALQIAIWEAVIDFDGTNYDLSSGNFQTSAYATDANNYLSDLATNWTDSSPITGLVMDDDLSGDKYYQDYLIKPIPEPTTMLLLGSGILGIGLVGWLRRKRS